jgi:hypothetical protein
VIDTNESVYLESSEAADRLFGFPLKGRLGSGSLKIEDSSPIREG